MKKQFFVRRRAMHRFLADNYFIGFVLLIGSMIAICAALFN
jgi:hypothetical protein